MTLGSGRVFLRQDGFTLVELVLYMVVSSIVLWSTTQLMVTQIDAYGLVATRQQALSDARYSFNRISSELIHLTTADIISIQPDNLTFIDQDGLQTDFRIAPNGNGQAVFRGNSLILTPVNQLQFTYLDSNDLATNVIANVRRLVVSVTTAEIGNEGTMTLTTSVIPRNFVYQNYQ